MKRLPFIYWYILFLISMSAVNAASIQKVAKIQSQSVLTFRVTKLVPTNVITWKSTRYYIDETNNTVTYATDTTTIIGDTARISLAKVTGKYTYYKIFAFEAGKADSVILQVLLPGVVQKYLYTNTAYSPYAIPVWVVIPTNYSIKSKFVMTMCGINRDASSIATYWVPFANTNNYVVAAPEFGTTNWSSDAYILGNMFTGSSGAGNLNPTAKWSFNIVEQIHRELFTSCSLSDSTYELWGHSAGGQFVHRLSFFLPDILISRYIAANSGWYTCPDLSTAFPWGAQNSKLNYTNTDITAFTNRNLVIMRGTADTVRDAALNTDPLSDAQGLNRYTRAGYFYNSGKTANTDLKWKMIDVAGVGHDDQKMAIEGGNYILSNLPEILPDASAIWNLTNDGIPVITGKITASMIDTLSSTNIAGFAGHSFTDTSFTGLLLGATGPSNWPAESGYVPIADLSGVTNGTVSNTRYIQFTVSPSGNQSLLVSKITIPLTESGTATNIMAVAGYATDGSNFTTFNSKGLSGDSLPANITKTIIVAPALTVNSGSNLTVRISLWRKATTAATKSSVYLGSVEILGTTTDLDAVGNEKAKVRGFELFQNYPNPFNPSTVISYTLASDSKVKLTVYNSLGKEISTLIDQVQNAGSHSVSFKAVHLASGVYYYRLQSGESVKAGKMLLLK